MPIESGRVDYAATPDVVAKNEAAFAKYGNQLTPGPEIIQPEYITTDVAAGKSPTRTPIYDASGKLIGYNVTTYNADGSIAGTTFQAAGAAALGTGKNSAYDLLLSQFSEYGLGALVEPLKNLITNDTSEGELTLLLRGTESYKKRFAANAERLAKGLTPLSEREYLGMEDQYQNVMRNYGLPASYYTKGDLGRQEGFEKLLANDVSVTELEDRVLTAQSRVINAAPEITTALKQFYPGITNGDILAYTLDPTKALTDIKRKITAAEIGGAAIGAGLGSEVTRAEELARYGVTAQTARQGYDTIGGGLERGRQLSSIYQQPDYNQTMAEQEIFNLPGQAESQQQRKKVIGLEKATFGGQTGISSGALSQNRAGSY